MKIIPGCVSTTREIYTELVLGKFLVYWCIKLSIVGLQSFIKQSVINLLFFENSIFQTNTHRPISASNLVYRTNTYETTMHHTIIHQTIILQISSIKLSPSRYHALNYHSLDYLLSKSHHQAIMHQTIIHQTTSFQTFTIKLSCMNLSFIKLSFIKLLVVLLSFTGLSFFKLSIIINDSSSHDQPCAGQRWSSSPAFPIASYRYLIKTWISEN